MYLCGWVSPEDWEGWDLQALPPLDPGRQGPCFRLRGKQAVKPRGHAHLEPIYFFLVHALDTLNPKLSF